MAADVTSYSVLGLNPGADREAIEKAYRRLIKRYHPDRPGGDGERAAEINRAYFDLRGRPAQAAEQRHAATVAEAIYMRRASRTRVPLARRRKLAWKRLTVLALLIAAAFWWSDFRAMADAVAADINDAMEPSTGYQIAAAPVEGPDPLAGGLHFQVITNSTRQVRALLASGRTEQVADLSRDCHRKMRTLPSAKRLDRCAAIDFTVVAIARSDAFHDDGPFSASAVTAREMSAAQLLSDDYPLIEARFDQVRKRIDALVNPAPVVPAPVAPAATIAPSEPDVVEPAPDQAVRTARPARPPD